MPRESRDQLTGYASNSPRSGKAVSLAYERPSSQHPRGLKRARRKLAQIRGLRNKASVILRWSNKQLQHLLYDIILKQEKQKIEVYEKLLVNPQFAQQFVDDHVPSAVVDGLILDAGCGMGRMLAALTTLGKQVVGVDVVPYDYWHRVRGAAFLVAELSAMPFRNAIFDQCLNLLVLEETRNDELVLQEVHRVLVANGSLLLQTPNGGNLRTRLTGRMLYAKHLREYQKNEIINLLESNGFAIRKVWIDGFYFPVLPRLINALMSRRAWLSVGNFLPERFRGVINIVCENFH